MSDLHDRFLDYAAASSVPAEMPDDELMNLPKEALDFFVGYASNTNALIDLCGMAAMSGDQRIFGHALAMLSAYSFNLGVAFAEQNKEK